MIIKDNLMFSYDKIKYIDIQERPVFNYDTKEYDRIDYYIVAHLDLNTHEIDNINLTKVSSKQEAKDYLISLSIIISELKKGNLEKVVI